jgi:hypothetical protein
MIYACLCLSGELQQDSRFDGDGDTNLALVCLRHCLPVWPSLAGATAVRWLAGWPPFAGAASSSLAASLQLVASCGFLWLLAVALLLGATLCHRVAPLIAWWLPASTLGNGTPPEMLVLSA